MSEFTAKAPQWDASSRRQALAQRIYESIRQRITLQPTMELLDLGAGTGLLTYKVLPHVQRITALDTSEAMLEQLRRKSSPTECVVPLLHDISKQPISGTYDGVISSMTLHHIEDLTMLFEHLYTALKQGGFIALADLLSEDGSFHSGDNAGVHHFGFDADELTARVHSVGFKEVRCEIVDVIHKEQHDYPVFLLTALK